ncbi:hypothetical protein G7Y89_g4359 [Cudoniella acicularis]|uniref:Uncharacterized protein n=1 Tax=Cudoniella acicularis TaxID=354080 RepID=A0A8H4RRR8_9HELO|nr:hypothetical protein G7Y89_g4359 [Cudoniella acicularis]
MYPNCGLRWFARNAIITVIVFDVVVFSVPIGVASHRNLKLDFGKSQATIQATQTTSFCQCMMKSAVAYLYKSSKKNLGEREEKKQWRKTYDPNYQPQRSIFASKAKDRRSRIMSMFGRPPSMIKDLFLDGLEPPVVNTLPKEVPRSKDRASRVTFSDRSSIATSTATRSDRSSQMTRSSMATTISTASGSGNRMKFSESQSMLPSMMDRQSLPPSYTAMDRHGAMLAGLEIPNMAYIEGRLRG